MESEHILMLAHLKQLASYKESISITQETAKVLQVKFSEELNADL